MMAREIYNREWIPSNESQLARKIQEKGGVKSVEHNDNALRELSEIDGPSGGQKVVQFKPMPSLQKLI